MNEGQVFCCTIFCFGYKVMGNQFLKMANSEALAIFLRSVGFLAAPVSFSK
jgi:hypothetical protein